MDWNRWTHGWTGFALRRGRAAALVAALIPLFVFYLGDVLGAKFARITHLPEMGWTPVVLLLVLGVPFCWRELVR